MGNKHKVIADPEYGYLRVDPIPSAQEVEKFYVEKFYSSEYKHFNDSSITVQKQQKDFFERRWKFIYDNLMNYFKDVGNVSIFDIGFGFAQALLYFRDKGMCVSGLEPSPEGVDYAKSKGLDVYRSNIEDFTYKGQKRFDVVLLLNVLEHVRRPFKILQDIKKFLLKPGGLLVIDVPNDFNDFQDIADREFNLDKWWVCPPSHINYFSATSLKNMLIKCGYDIFSCEASFPMEIFMLLGDIYAGNTELGMKCHQKRVKFEQLMDKYAKSDKLSKLYKALAELDLGRQVAVYAKSK